MSRDDLKKSVERGDYGPVEVVAGVHKGRTAVYDDDTPDLIVPGALFYHSTSVRPGWARTRSPVAKIGNHVFYR